MKLNAHEIAKLNKDFAALEKDEKIISINDVKKRLEELLNLKDELEDLLSEQLLAIEIVDDSCEDDDETCGCENEEVEQSELYEFYNDLEDIVLTNNLEKALRRID